MSDVNGFGYLSVLSTGPRVAPRRAMFERSTTLWVALTLGLAGLALAIAGCSNNELSNNNNNPLPDLAIVSTDMAVGPDLSLPDRDPTNHPDLPQVENGGG